ncbi:MAG TPA: ammonia-forming cytochrome c nitrite reductase subunit c552 [Terriglobales bacterium]|nr:ammonia-forming cytochrome c nitrite reductase subunit c552 [Terriglobales bacterium]
MLLSALFSRLRVLFLLALALPLSAQSERHYVGSSACLRCHATVHSQWSGSVHRKMVQTAGAQSVQGDFARGKVALHGSNYLFRQSNGSYAITESDLTGKPVSYRVDYTLGDDWVQQYLTKLPDGRIVLLAPAWDIRRRGWVHDQDIANPEESGSGVQVWNRSCFSCHVSGGKKNFNVETLQYRTTWRSAGVDCEECHGPGSEHVARASAAKALDAGTRKLIRDSIVNPARLDPLRSTMICAQCHSLSDEYSNAFRPGDNYSDFYEPVMDYRLPASQDPAYWPDGRPRWLSNEVSGLWESQCFLKGGATCITCHAQAHDIDDAHNVKLRAGSNAMCTQCHGDIGANLSAHTHHAANSAGSSCIECHMPATVVGITTAFRDHSISVPVPGNTFAHQTPNACNLCHRDKDAIWAAQQIATWYGEGSGRQWIARANAFTEARSGDASAIPLLEQILADSSQGPLLRANAAGYLGGFPDDPSAYEAVLHAFSDPEALVRETAVEAIRPRAAQRAAVAPALVKLLRDPVAIVRTNAAVALVAMGVREVPGDDEAWFKSAQDLYRSRAELNADQPQQQFAAGRFFLLAGDVDAAIRNLRSALKLDDKLPAQYLLARALAEKGEYNDARQILKGIPPNDAQYSSAQQLLTDLELKTANENTKINLSPSSAEAEADFRDAQVLFQNDSYGGALPKFEQALSLAPQAKWAATAKIDRAICLEKLGRTDEAEAALQTLSQNPGERQNVELQLAFVELLYDTGHSPEALKRADDLISASPKSPMAQVWRAKVLLQLKRVDEAAQAAEEAIRLQPELPVAHNLLIRIYQLQGRTAQAAEQARWVHDYERRIQSR